MEIIMTKDAKSETARILSTLEDLPPCGQANALAFVQGVKLGQMMAQLEDNQVAG